MPITVARVITRMPLGGIERKIVKFFELADRQRFSYHLVCIHDRGPLADEVEKLGIPVHLIKFRTRLDPGSLYRLARWLRQERVGIVHAHMYRANTSASVAAWFAHVPVMLCHMHSVNTWDSRRQILMDRLLHRFRTRVIAVSKAVADNVIAVTHVSPDKVDVIYNGVDLDEFHPGPPPSELLTSLGVKPGVPVVGFVGRLVSAKAPEVFVEVARRVLTEHSIDAQFLMIGGGSLETSLRAHIQELGLADRIILTGERRDVPLLLRGLELLASTSRREGFADILLESMATGVPVVATDVGGNAEVVTDGINGYLARSGDAAGIASHVAALLRNPELRVKMSHSASENIQAFSLPRMVNNIESLYERLWQSQTTQL